MNNIRDELGILTGRPIRIVDPVEFAGPVIFEELSESPLEFIGLSDTTPSVLNLERIKFQNTSPTTVTNFDDGQEGQYIIVVGDGQTTVQHGTNIFNTAGANITLANGRVYAYVKVEGVWREQGGTPNPNLSFSSNALTSNQNITTPGTFVTGATLSLGSGTWLISGHITVRVNSTTPANIVSRITLTSPVTILASTEQSSGTVNPNYSTMTMTAIVSLVSASSVTLSATATAAAIILSATADYSGGNNATQLTALRVA